MADDEVKLKNIWPSMFGASTKIALEEKKVKYVEEELTGKDKYPILVHNGKSISPSVVQIEYIDETWPGEAPILPTDAYERAQARRLAYHMDHQIYSAGRNVMVKQGKEGEAAKEELLKALKQLESKLGDKPYFGGDKMGFADIVFIGHYSWFPTYEAFGGMEIDEAFPNLVAWAERCMEKESVANSVPDRYKVLEWNREVRKRFSLSVDE